MTAQRNMNSKAREIAQNKFKDMMRNGAFPKVQYKDGNGFQSYSMIEYSTTWARFCKVVQNELVAKGIEFGLWQNARNQSYLNTVKEVCDGITEDKVNASEEKFQTIWG